MYLRHDQQVELFAAMLAGVSVRPGAKIIFLNVLEGRFNLAYVGIVHTRYNYETFLGGGGVVFRMSRGFILGDGGPYRGSIWK